MNRFKGNISLARKFSALLMLSCYVLIFFQINLVHHFQHDQSDHHHVHHDTETEQDACHRAIYHADQNDGCAHDAHILGQSEPCEFCDSLLSQTDLLEDLEQYQKQENIALFNSIFSPQFSPNLWSKDTPHRGPPATFS